MDFKEIVAYAGAKPCLMRQCEVDWFKEIILDGDLPGGDILEIGAYCCATSNIFAYLAKETGRKVTSIDIGEAVLKLQGQIPNEFYGMKIGLHQKLLDYASFILASSDVGVKSLLYDDDRTFAFVLIDGNHVYPYPKNDFILSTKMVPVGGVVAFHDTFTTPSGIRQSLDELKNEGHFDNWEKITDDNELGRHHESEIKDFCNGPSFWSITAFKRKGI